MSTDDYKYLFVECECGDDCPSCIYKLNKDLKNPKIEMALLEYCVELNKYLNETLQNNTLSPSESHDYFNTKKLELDEQCKNAYRDLTQIVDEDTMDFDNFFSSDSPTLYN